MIPAGHVLFKRGTAPRRLYDRLVCGPATTRQIVQGLHISRHLDVLGEIEEALHLKTNITVAERPTRTKGVLEYRLAIRPMDS